MFPLTIAFWGALLWLAASFFGREHRSSRTDEAERILAERYARGELEPEEYRRRLEDIRG
jgi:putative membrane protein